MTLDNHTIHYCWFGNNKKPKKILKCIETWKKFFPDWEIKEWNESNFDVNICDYTKEAYEAKKWAFVSDYARVWVLYNYGGLYFDTDVEVLREFDEEVNYPLLSLEHGMDYCINPGVIMGCNKGNDVCKKIISAYDSEHFKLKDGYNPLTICDRFTNLFLEHGFVKENTFQQILGYNIYPIEYFSPYDNYNRTKHVTENTYSIHLYLGSWLSPWRRLRDNLSYVKRKIFK